MTPTPVTDHPARQAATLPSRPTSIRRLIVAYPQCADGTLMEMPDQPSGDSAEDRLALQRALPGYGDKPRRFTGLLQKRESAGDWASAGGEATDVGPVGWLFGALAGLIG